MKNILTLIFCVGLMFPMFGFSVDETSTWRSQSVQTTTPDNSVNFEQNNPEFMPNATTDSQVRIDSNRVDTNLDSSSTFSTEDPAIKSNADLNLENQNLDNQTSTFGTDSNLNIDAEDRDVDATSTFGSDRNMDIDVEDRDVDATSTFGRDRDLDMHRDHDFDRSSTFFARDTHVHPDRDQLVVKVREFVRQDPVLVTDANNVDFVACQDRVVIFGVVPSEKMKTDIEARVKQVEGVSSVENKLIVK